MAGVELWCRVRVVGADGAELAGVVLRGRGAPDLGSVDAIARLMLAARRIGGDITVSEVSPDMGALLALAGLGVEMEGQAELGEEPFGFQKSQEETHPGDLPS